MDDQSVNAGNVVSSHKQWVKDGVLYNEHIGGLTLVDALEVIQKSVIPLNEQKLKSVPVVVIFTNVDKTTFRLSLSDYSKLITSFKIVERISEVWVVCAPVEVRKMIEPFSKIFFSGRFHFAMTLEEAENDLKQRALDQTPILEK